MEGPMEEDVEEADAGDGRGGGAPHWSFGA